MARLNTPVYGADFETIVNSERTRVWLWGLKNFASDIFEYGTDIDSFMNRISKISCKVYFHNLKFDIQFILYWLFNNGFIHTTNRKVDRGKFSTLISDMGLFYTLKVTFNNNQTVTFLDSYKLIPLPIEKIPGAFGLPLKKLDLDYEAVIDLDHTPTEQELEYLKADVDILVGGVKAMHEHNLKKMTAASNALNNYKGVIGKDIFDTYFPPLTLVEDRDCRLSYKGGWTYLNPKYKDKRLGKGRVYDVNSMYPWAMKNCFLPYGPVVYFKGKYIENDIYPLYIQTIRCRFKVKDGHYPSIQLKGNMRFLDTEYISECMEDCELLTLTSIDLKLFYDNYDVFDLEFMGGYMMRGKYGLFSDYIDYWYGVKSEAKKNGNKAMSQIAKLMLNSLYGKFGSNPRKRSKYPYYNHEKDIVSYSLGVQEVTTGGYVPMAAFITSYCRDKIIRAANSCGERFIYADTDSIHIIGEDEPDIDIDEYRLGAFKLESEFMEAQFHRAKCYIESIDGKLDKKCAGLPKAAKELLNFETMCEGSVFHGKLVPVNVPGGVVLIDREFTIK